MAWGAYYFFAASLPPLVFGQAPVLDIETFRAQCREQLSSDDARAVECLLGDGTEPARGFVTQWRSFDRSLAGALAVARAAALGREYTLQGEAPELEQAQLAAESLRLDSPLERERKIDEARWNWAGERASWDIFSAEAIMAYAIQLTIATRWAAFDEAAGAKRLGAAVADATARALSHHLKFETSTEAPS